MNLRRLAIALLLGLISASAEAQQTYVAPPVGIGCAYNSALPTLATGFAGWAQCDSSGRLIINPSNTSGSPLYVQPGTGSTWAATQSGIWQVTPTTPAGSVMTLTSTTTAYTAGHLVANSGAAGSIANPSFAMPSLGGAIPRIRLISSDTGTGWQSAVVQADLWDASPTWTNGDHGAWKPATGSTHHLAQFTCAFPSAVWGDGLGTECIINQGNYLSTVATTIYWSVEVLTPSGNAVTASQTLTLKAELN